MPTYTPPLRDMQFLMHEVFKITDDYKQMSNYAEVDADTINAVLEEAGKFATNVTFPLNISGDTEGCVLDKATHEVKTPTGFKEAYKQFIDGGWPALSSSACCCSPQITPAGAIAGRAGGSSPGWARSPTASFWCTFQCLCWCLRCGCISVGIRRRWP